MPKKFKSENTKAVAARERRSAAEADRKTKKEQEEDDAYWKDDDKYVMNKQKRKDDKEKKRLEQLERKLEQQKMLEEEEAQLKSGKPAAATKLTRALIEQQRAEREAAGTKAEVKMHDEVPLQENINQLDNEGDEARTVEDAIQVLSVKDNLDKHPEKRLKAAYTAYEEVNLPRLKAENPNLRLSQLKQMLKKDWQKSPENPLNQRFMNYNEKK